MHSFALVQTPLCTFAIQSLASNIITALYLIFVPELRTCSLYLYFAPTLLTSTYYLDLYLHFQNEAEEDLDIVMGGESDDDEQEVFYNPLKLPLGFDGKPIPYWLYKLHGLNQEFKCQICGDYSYWGRRAFEKHFKEWRH